MKYVLVTGAYGGMGKACVAELQKSGYCVIALDKATAPPTKNVIPINVDLTDEKTVKNAYEKVASITDELFAIIHLAGVYMLDSLVEMETEKYKKIFDINVHGAFLVNKIFRPLLKKGSRIVIITSELAPLDPLPFTGIYAITKSALDKYAYSLRMELQLLDIAVSVLRAGAVTTPMLGASTSALDQFCENTKIYSYNSKRFKKIVDSVEARSVPPEKVARKIHKILSAKKTHFAYKLNRNPLLLLLNVLPKPVQLSVIKAILK